MHPWSHVICVAPASRLFSSISLSALAGRCSSGQERPRWVWWRRGRERGSTREPDGRPADSCLDYLACRNAVDHRLVQAADRCWRRRWQWWQRWQRRRPGCYCERRRGVHQHGSRGGRAATESVEKATKNRAPACCELDSLEGCTRPPAADRHGFGDWRADRGSNLGVRCKSSSLPLHNHLQQPLAGGKRGQSNP